MRLIGNARRAGDKGLWKTEMNSLSGRSDLTGPMGARINRPVALVTDDFRLYHELAPFFEAQGVQLLGLRPGEAVPDAVQVLLNGPGDDPRSVATHADPEATWLAALSVWDTRQTQHVMLGIDPGETLGLAVVVGGLVYWTAQVRGVEAAVERILAWRPALSSWQANVGDGAPDIGIDLCRRLRKAWPDLPTRIVSEAGSTPPSPVTESRHTDAAVRIALR